MKKQLKTLLILLVVLAVLLAAFLIIRAIQTRREALENAEGEVQYLYEPEVITRLSLENQYGTFTFSYNTADFSWSYVGHEDYAVDKTTMDKFADELIQSRIDRKIDTFSSLADFGLEKPAYTLRVTDDMGTEHTFLFGGRSGDGTNYYVIRDDEPVIYNVTTNIYLYLEYKLSDCVSFTVPEAIEEAELNSLVLVRDGAEITINKITSESHRTITGLHGQPQEVTDYTYTWEVEDPDPSWTVSGAAYETAMYDVVELLTKTGMHFTSCIGYDPDASDKKDLGLDKPTLKIQVDSNGTENDWTLSVGGNDMEYWDNGNYKSGGYYARLSSDLAVVNVDYRNIDVFSQLLDVITGEAQ